MRRWIRRLHLRSRHPRSPYRRVVGFSSSGQFKSRPAANTHLFRPLDYQSHHSLKRRPDSSGPTLVMSSHELRFVHHPLPGDAGARRRQQRVVHSNAARAAHAETRRLRTIRYQAAKAQEPKQLAALEPEADVVAAPGIVRLLSADRKDPFASFVRPLKPVEHFLLDHCTKIGKH